MSHATTGVIVREIHVTPMSHATTGVIVREVCGLFVYTRVCARSRLMQDALFVVCCPMTHEGQRSATAPPRSPQHRAAPSRRGRSGLHTHRQSDHPWGNPRISVSSARTMAAPASR
eukprot:7381961-Prymnesium_polylepis.1